MQGMPCQLAAKSGWRHLLDRLYGSRVAIDLMIVIIHLADLQEVDRLGELPGSPHIFQPYDVGPIRSHLLPAMSRNTATWP